VWQQNQQPPTPVSGYNAAADPRRVRPARPTSTPTTPDAPYAGLPTPVSAYAEYPLPSVPEDQAYVGPQATGGATVASASYMPRKVSNDHAATTTAAAPSAPSAPRAMLQTNTNWTWSPSRAVFATAKLIVPMRNSYTDQVSIQIRLVNGAAIAPLPVEDEGMTLRSLCGGPRDEELDLWTELLEGYCLTGQLACGSRVLEWAKVAWADEVEQDWQAMRGLLNGGKVSPSS
jgi:hypothetical protein